MSAAARLLAMTAIADALTDRYDGIEVIVYDGRPLPPGARRLRVTAALDEREPVRDRLELRPAARGGDLDARDQ